ncbi:MAG: TolC family protein [Deltaproteobacteria bacterium]|nr:TolC family protein [Deltaproteobacteria bacterium]
MNRPQPFPCRKLAQAILMLSLPYIASCQSALLSPFRSVDHVDFAPVNASRMLAESRSRPVTAALGKRSLTLEDCRQMALTNNLEVQVARWDELTREAVRWSSRARMLPHLSFTGDLSQRDNPLYSYSDVLGQEGLQPSADGTGVTSYSTGHERTTWRYVFETRWSPVDAALAYYVSKSASNDRLKAHYQKVRVAQKLIGAVDGAYFRLLSLQQSLSYAKRLAGMRAQIAASMQRLQNKSIIRVEDYERAEERAVEARRVLGKVRNETERQRNILASAMGLSPEYCVDGGFCVEGKMSSPCFGAPLCDLELIAVKHRPEAFQAGLDHLTSVNDIKRTIVRYLPKVEGFWRYTRDKDKFLYNKDWKDIGVLVHFDLLDWLINRNDSRAARSAATKTYKELGAVALGIASQVRVAALTYNDSLEECQTREAALAGSQKVLKMAQIRVAGDDLSQLQFEEAEANLLMQKIQRIRALGEANAACAELQSVLGTNYKEPAPCEG